MEIQKNLILLSNLSCYLMRYNYRIITNYDSKTQFYCVKIVSFKETKTSVESHLLCGCQSKNFAKVLSFVLSKIQEIIEK